MACLQRTLGSWCGTISPPATSQPLAISRHEILTESDPLWDLAGEDLMRAQVDGVRAKYSPHLKQGVAITLALLWDSSTCAERRRFDSVGFGAGHRLASP